jgi:hypothetical protein
LGWGGFSQALKEAIELAHAEGIIFVAAAGNANSDNDQSPSYPASYDVPNIVSVAATDHNDQLASFSNFGQTSVDLAAPGVGIWSTVPGDSYASLSGTSMASPHVAGVLALMQARFPSLGHLALIERLLNSVDVLPHLATKVGTSGRLNASNTLQGVDLPWLAITPTEGTVLPGDSLTVSILLKSDNTVDATTNSILSGTLSMLHNAHFDSIGNPLATASVNIPISLTLTEISRLAVEVATGPHVLNVPFDVTVSAVDAQGRHLSGVEWFTLGASHAGVQFPQGPQALSQGSNTFQVTVPLGTAAAAVEDLILTAANTSRNLFGQSQPVAFVVPTIDAPDQLEAVDFPNDNGEQILLTFPYSDNHPGSAAAIGNPSLQNNPIDYYQIYRNETDAFTAALPWAFVPATPIPAGGPTTMRLVVPTFGNSDLAHYWVVAVKGPIPSTSVRTPSTAGAAKIATATPNQAPVSTNGVHSSYAGPALALPIDNFSKGNFNADHQVDRRDLIALLSQWTNASVDPVFDLDGDGDIGVADIQAWKPFAGQRKTGVAWQPVTPDSLATDVRASIRLREPSGSQHQLRLAIETDHPLEWAACEIVLQYDPAAYRLSGHASEQQQMHEGIETLVIPSQEGTLRILLGTRGMQNITSSTATVAEVTLDRMAAFDTQGIRLAEVVLVDSQGRETALVSQPVYLTPERFALASNYPNPFNPETTIGYTLAQTTPVHLSIYDILGQHVKTLVSETLHSPGYYWAVWDGLDESGQKVSSGTYLYRLETREHKQVRKMLLLK